MSVGRNPALRIQETRAAAQALLRKTAANMRSALNPLLTWRPGLKDLAEVFLVASALPLYYLVRGQAQERGPEAIARGVDIANFEKSLGIFWEVQLQSWILPYDWLVSALNAFYLYGHLPIIGALAIWMYFWHRPQYLLMRNAFLISGAIGLVVFLNFPTAPPRLLPGYLGFGFVDTFAGFGVMLLGLAVAVAGKRLVMRVFSPSSKAARNKGWRSWLYWLCGVPAPAPKQQGAARQPA